LIAAAAVLLGMKESFSYAQVRSGRIRVTPTELIINPTMPTEMMTARPSQWATD
jgi:hypothetical protein